MKLLPSALSEKHVGMVCVVRYSTQRTGFIGHSHAHGLESGGVFTSYVLVGRLCMVSETELVFLNSSYSRHAHDLSFRHGPHYRDEEDIHIVSRKDLSKRKLVINTREKSNAVMQHLRSNKAEFWNVERRLAEKVKDL